MHRRLRPTWWLLQATQLTHPRLQPLYRLDGGSSLRSETWPWPATGDRARSGWATLPAQQQLDTYGELLQCAWLYAGSGGRIDAEVGHRLGEVADLVHALAPTRRRHLEVRSEPLPFTHSKMMCWVALERAGQLADRGLLPRGHRGRWRREADACRDYIETHCYSGSLAAYAWSAGSEDLDASVLLGLLSGYGSPGGNRWVTTVDAIDAGSATDPTSTATPAATGRPGRRGLSSAAPSGLPRPWPAPAGSPRRPR